MDFGFGRSVLCSHSALDFLASAKYDTRILPPLLLYISISIEIYRAYDLLCKDETEKRAMINPFPFVIGQFHFT